METILTQNGQQDLGEPGISGASVILLNGITNAVITGTTTIVMDQYPYNNLTPGSYKVQFATPSGFTQVCPLTMVLMLQTLTRCQGLTVASIH